MDDAEYPSEVCPYKSEENTCTEECPLERDTKCCYVCDFERTCLSRCTYKGERAEIYMFGDAYRYSMQEQNKIQFDGELILHTIYEKGNWQTVSKDDYDSCSGAKKVCIWQVRSGEDYDDILGRDPDIEYFGDEYDKWEKWDNRPITYYTKSRYSKPQYRLRVTDEMFLGICETYDTESEMLDLKDDNPLYDLSRMIFDEFLDFDEETLLYLLTILVAKRCPYLYTHSRACYTKGAGRLIWLTAQETYENGGICTEQSLVLLMLLRELGYNCALYRPSMNHMNVLVLGFDGVYYECDTTSKRVDDVDEIWRIKGKEEWEYVRSGCITLDELETGHNKAALYRRAKGKKICANHDIPYEAEKVLAYEWARVIKNEERDRKKKEEEEAKKEEEKKKLDEENSKALKEMFDDPKEKAKEKVQSRAERLEKIMKEKKRKKIEKNKRPLKPDIQKEWIPDHINATIECINIIRVKNKVKKLEEFM